MGFIRKQHLSEQKIAKEKLEAYLKDIQEVNKKHVLILVPYISKYGASLEIQELKDQNIDNQKT